MVKNAPNNMPYHLFKALQWLLNQFVYIFMEIDLNRNQIRLHPKINQINKQFDREVKFFSIRAASLFLLHHEKTRRQFFRCGSVDLRFPWIQRQIWSRKTPWSRSCGRLVYGDLPSRTSGCCRKLTTWRISLTFDCYTTGANVCLHTYKNVDVYFCICYDTLMTFWCRLNFNLDKNSFVI